MIRKPEVSCCEPAPHKHRKDGRSPALNLSGHEKDENILETASKQLYYLILLKVKYKISTNMKNLNLTALSDVKLLMSLGLLKGFAIGLGITSLAVICIWLYIYFTKDYDNIPMVTFLPAIGLPMSYSFTSLILQQFKKEAAARELKSLK